MAAAFDHVTPEQAALIASAPLFFVGSAAPGLEHGPAGAGPVNVSPKGGVRLHVLTPNRVAYVDFRGSGNETARHAALGGPVTVMACSFEPGDAAIVRLYGRARVVAFDDHPDASRLAEGAPPDMRAPRQVVEIDVESTLTSCGYGVPVMSFVGPREVVGRGRKYK